jgi:hypothetical protein
MTGLGDLVREIKEASRNITTADAKNAQRLEAIEASVTDGPKPGAFPVTDGTVLGYNMN